MHDAGAASCTRVEGALSFHLRRGRFQQVLVVNDHHVLITRVDITNSCVPIGKVSCSKNTLYRGAGLTPVCPRAYSR